MELYERSLFVRYHELEGQLAVVRQELQFAASEIAKERLTGDCEQDCQLACAYPGQFGCPDGV